MLTRGRPFARTPRAWGSAAAAAPPVGPEEPSPAGPWAQGPGRASGATAGTSLAGVTGVALVPAGFCTGASDPDPDSGPLSGPVLGVAGPAGEGRSDRCAPERRP
ncbi:hypothetical protein GCM10018781_56440 [Kitasatospora indigofera]|uniref:Uncharacterized protein n=1 Tax=Kitasatospora indigofera TaxID=67307 RepID=A0A919G790_9ACTN|nr:hypothetical protein GCM10018781_56440 [Kitasatospora indigofera]